MRLKELLNNGKIDSPEDKIYLLPIKYRVYSFNYRLYYFLIEIKSIIKDIYTNLIINKITKKIFSFIY